MNTRIMAVALVAVGLIGVRAAQADETGRLPTGPNYEDKILVVTGRMVSTGTVCDVESDLYSVVITGGHPAIVTTLAVAAGTAISPGNRFDLTGQAPCGGGTHQVMQMAGPLMPRKARRFGVVGGLGLLVIVACTLVAWPGRSAVASMWRAV